MHRGFKLSLNWEGTKYFASGLNQFLENKTLVERKIKSFIGSDGVLNGTQLQESWFPQVSADIFISHSHKDKNSAITLAGWIQEVFGLSVFIDSCIWGYSEDLLRLIDNHYCLNPGGGTYSYEKRNQSTSHVHMMLSTALTMMIDQAECLFFLNTPNSIQTGETIDKTKSPWIYNEIAISRLIRKKKLSEYRPERTKAFTDLGRIDESFVMNYDANLSHLQNLTADDLIQWKEDWGYVSLHEKYPLNKLYELFPIDNYL